MDNKVLLSVLTAVAIFSATGILSQDSQNNLSSQWSLWKAQYGKTYPAQDEALRFAIWTQNKIRIDAHNAQASSYRLGLNEFSDKTKEERVALYHGYKKSDMKLPAYVPKNTQPLTDVDWRNKGAVTPVKNQGQCGSCWAFGTVGGIEGGYAVAKGNLVSFSEQQITSCDTSDYGCNGGNLAPAYQYVNGAGLDTESEYPYTSGGGNTGSCRQSGKQTTIAAGQCSGSAVQADSSSAFIQALSEQPLSICVDAEASAFMDYSGGVVDSNCGESIDHCVTAVGYSQSASTPYVIVKNSWGTSWGESGYIRIAIQGGGSSGLCGIYSGPYSANIN